VNRHTIIKRLGSYKLPQKVIVDDQTVPDIMTGMVRKHRECTAHYDAICGLFDADSWYDVADQLWLFCKENFQYCIEGLDAQFVSSPLAQLERGHNDCKGYSLFCAGVIDALKRKGYEVDWCYRFASYNLLRRTPGHVFVVINPTTDNIWIDPVMNRFDQHYMYFWHKDIRVDTARKIAGVGCMPCMDGGYGSIGSAEDDLLAQVKAYSDGIDNAVQYANSNGALNDITVGILKTASSAVPGLSQALAIVSAGQSVLNNTFGPGSLAARLFAAMSSNVLTAPFAIIKALFTGRTFNSDQYAGAQMYQYNVLGKGNITNENQIADADIFPALKWFIDRLGVFISGREHINALIESPQKYISYYSVNPYTTTDIGRVTQASAVAKKYFYQTGSQPPGLWANTIGVYDPMLVALAQQMGQSVEQVSREVNQGQIPSPVQPVAGGVPSWLWIGLGVSAAVILSSD
jgi:hypothetical protein